MRKQTKLAVMLASIALLVVSVASIVSARGWVQQGGNWYYQNSEGDFVAEEIQNSNNSKFYLGEDGAMVTDYFLEDYGDNNNTYYFGSNGAMVTNTWVAIDPSIVSNQGEYVPTVYWYYFGSTGKAIKAAEGSYKRTNVDGKYYAFNEYGQMLTGWIKADGQINDPDGDNPFSDALYFAGGDNDGVLRSGWLAYYDGASNLIHISASNHDLADRDVLYFYFSTSNNKKVGNENGTTASTDDYVTKKINGRTYAFRVGDGVMLSGWDTYDAVNHPATGSYYFSAEDDGHQVKKGWVYAVPDESIDQDSFNDDSEEYMYFQNNGTIVKNCIYKVNGKHYAFNTNGIMKTGLIAYYVNDGQYAVKFNGDNTRGGELAKSSIFRNGDNQQVTMTRTANGLQYQSTGHALADVKIHYFGSDGARRTGSNNIEFADDTYTFGSDNNGHFDGLKKKKYYTNGILLKASSDIRYGIYATDSAVVGHGYAANVYENGHFYVLNTGGSRVKGTNGSKKDADGNYWLIAATNNTGDYQQDELIGIYSVEVRWHLLTPTPNGDASDGTVSNNTEGVRGIQFKADSSPYGDNKWLNGDNGNNSYAAQYDSTHTTVVLAHKGLDSRYGVAPTNDHSLNFLVRNE